MIIMYITGSLRFTIQNKTENLTKFQAFYSHSLGDLFVLWLLLNIQQNIFPLDNSQGQETLILKPRLNEHKHQLI